MYIHIVRSCEIKVKTAELKEQLQSKSFNMQPLIPTLKVHKIHVVWLMYNVYTWLKLLINTIEDGYVLKQFLATNQCNKVQPLFKGGYYSMTAILKV